MIYQVVSEKVNYFQELKKILKIETFSFRSDGTTAGKYIFYCFKDRLPFSLKEMAGIIIKENGKTVMICGDGSQIIEYLKKTVDFTPLKIGLEG